MAVEESNNILEDSTAQNGTPDHQPAVDIVEEIDAAAATVAAPSDSSSTVVGQVAVNTADSEGEDTTGGRDSIDTTMNTERHNAQSSAVTVIAGNEFPAVSMNYSATSTGYSESPRGGHVSHAPTFIRPDEYGRPADDDNDDEPFYMGAKESGLLYQDKGESRYPAITVKPGWTEAHERTAVSATHPADLAATMECAYKVVVGPRFTIGDTIVARAQHGIIGNYGDRPIESRLSLLLSLYPELQNDRLEIDTLTEQPTRDVFEYFYNIRMDRSNARYMHVWRRNYEGSLQCVKIPRESVTRNEYSSSFVGHPESIWSFVVEGDRGGFRVPSITTIANMLRGKSRLDMDQDMAILTEMVQTGMYIQEMVCYTVNLRVTVRTLEPV
jgi:hypothetical protein